jgi:hypothetical protein
MPLRRKRLRFGRELGRLRGLKLESLGVVLLEWKNHPAGLQLFNSVPRDD